MERGTLAAMEAHWSDEYRRTRAARFRGPRQVVPEFLYPWVMLYEGRGHLLPQTTTWRHTFYHPLENILPWAWYGTLSIRLRRPRFITFNDNFDDAPHPGVMRWMRAFLDQRYPERSRFERCAPALPPVSTGP
jgi:hypothetical protein